MAEDKDRILEENFTKAMNNLGSRGFDLKVKEEQKSLQLSSCIQGAI